MAKKQKKTEKNRSDKTKKTVKKFWMNEEAKHKKTKKDK